MKKILIIEDDHDIMVITKLILEKEGYKVDTFTNFIGYEDVVNEARADLILLDLNIHGYHGKVICKYIKSEPHLKQTKVILMSADPDIEDIKNEADADALISKPFGIETLLKTVKMHINHTAGNQH